MAGETRAISASFKGVVRAVAPFNEPDNSFAGNFMTDPAVRGTTYDNRVNWLWTHTVQTIRGIDATIPVMGPNWVSYYPQRNNVDQPRMKAFLQNAIATNTVPDFMAWHQLYGGTPADYGVALNQYYRPLESSLGLPKLPLIVEEYGVNNGGFAGIPSALIPYWAEYERYGVSYASAGVYDNGGTLGNTVGPFGERDQQPNAGWWASNWYMVMTGRYVPTTPAAARYSGAFDGVGAYDPTTHTGTLVLGGPADQASIVLKGVGSLIGGAVRVQVLDAAWTQDVNEPNSTLEHGGDPVYAPTELFDKRFTADASGNVTVPLHLQNLHGYRLLVTPTATVLSPRYEAENAIDTNTVLHTGVSAASGGAYVGGIGTSNSTVSFTVIAPSAGAYDLTVAYAAPVDATQGLRVNGAIQSPVAYPSTGGDLDATTDNVVQRVTLRAGVNTLLFSGGSGVADLDYISLAKAAAYLTKYEAEFATRTDVTTYGGATLASGSAYVGGINDADSVVTFHVTVPDTGLYDLTARYAASGSAATHGVIVNGLSQGSISYAATAGWSNADLSTATKLVALRAGANTIAFVKGTNYAELDFISLQPDTHRYEAETATTTNATAGHFPHAYTYSFTDYVGGINAVGAGVNFAVQAPVAGTYTLGVGYGNGMT